LWIGARPDSSVVLTMNRRRWSPAVTWPRSNALFAWWRTRRPLRKRCLALITSLISCMPSVRYVVLFRTSHVYSYGFCLCTNQVVSRCHSLSIGMLVKEWRKENSPKRARILLRSKRITKRSAPRLARMVDSRKSIKFSWLFFICQTPKTIIQQATHVLCRAKGTVE
jgi:hypothetical protein